MEIMYRKAFTSKYYYISKFTTRSRRANRTITKVIDSMGFITIDESVNCVQAFLGSMPGNLYNNIRKPILNSITLSRTSNF